jgi:hypothetical protein
MFFKSIFILIFGFAPFIVFSQDYTVSGTIKDFKTGEPIPGAAVFELNSLTIGTFTNAAGYFKLRFDIKRIDLKVDYIG